MKRCLGCFYAEWEKNADGKLHRSGDGRCLYKYRIPKLPSCLYWINSEPKPRGGHISRREDLKDNCVYYQPVKEKV